MVAVQEVVFSGPEVNFLVLLQSFAHSHAVVGDPEVLTVPLVTDTYNYPILRESVEAAVKLLKKGKSPGIDNIPGELVQAGGDAVISVLHKICNKIWQTAHAMDPVSYHHPSQERPLVQSTLMVT